MKNKWNKYRFQQTARNAKAICRQLIIPFAIFQGIRTILFPTTIDILLLVLFIAIALGFHYEWI